jgi:hypothetical protein
MKPNIEPCDSGGLNKALAQWEAKTPLPPRFQEQVWKRIERAEATYSFSFATVLVRLLEVVLPRPKVALAYVSCILAVGVAAGALAAQVRSSRMESDLGTRYVQRLDPYRVDNSHP